MDGRDQGLTHLRQSHLLLVWSKELVDLDRRRQRHSTWMYCGVVCVPYVILESTVATTRVFLCTTEMHVALGLRLLI